MTERTELEPGLATLARQFQESVLEPMKKSFVGKDEVIDLLGISLVGGENLFLLGPPGTAKSALVQELGRRLDGRVFDYLLTRFTEPNELFGPFDIRKLREGELVTNTQGMLPEAAFVFLDELLHANSAILNSLLMVLNERVFRRGRETIPLPLLMVVGASNHLPEEESLRALFDRFLLRVHCDNVPTAQLTEVLLAGWKREVQEAETWHAFSAESVRELQRSLRWIDLGPVLPDYVELIRRLRIAGMSVSDRRAVKLQRVVAASALLCGRGEAQVSDLWVLRYIWDSEEEQSLLESLVRQAIGTAPSDTSHARARQPDHPDPEELAREILRLKDRAANVTITDAERSALRDRLTLTAGRCEWVQDSTQRSYLQEQIADVSQKLGMQS